MLKAMSNALEVDFLILADRAEVLNGKLYMMGGGWDALGMPGPDQPAQFTAVLAFLVPWNATNIDHICNVRLEDADGTSMLNINYNIKTGRPPNLPEGATQRLTVCLPIIAAFPQPGPYAVVAVAGEQEKRVSFHVRAASPQAPPSRALLP
jgi:hypothetical protein